MSGSDIRSTRIGFTGIWQPKDMVPCQWQVGLDNNGIRAYLYMVGTFRKVT